MKTHLRVFAIVVFILVIGCGTASAYSKTETRSVLVNLDGVPRMISTDAKTVGAVLTQLAATIDTDYLLEDYNETDAVTDMMTISLTSVTEKIVADTASVPYETIERASTKLSPGERRVVQKGKDGQASTVNKEIYHGSELVETQFVESRVITEPVDEIVEIGASNIVAGMTYRAALNMKVTAYTPYDPGCNGITATGTKAGKGVIAVDPSVIPMGTRVYIPGYGIAVAQDVGGAIKGNRIDVCYETKDEAYSWGVQDLTVYLLA